MSSPSGDDEPDTVRISARRFEPSPYLRNYINDDTVMGVAAGRYFASFNGEDVVETYWRLRRQAVLFDVPEKPWQIDGPDAAAFLENVFARRVDSLAPGRGRYVIACTPAGGTFMDGILFRLSSERFWFVQPDGACEEWLIAHSGGYDLAISDPGSRVLQIQGPNSMKIMAAATGGAIDAGMRYFHSGHFDIDGQRVFVSRTGWTGELGYEIYSEAATTDHQKLWDSLFRAGEPHGMTFGSLAAMGTRRIEAGILDNISDFDSRLNPYEAGLGRFIDLDSTDFIGRSALLEARREPLILGLRCANCAVNDDDAIFEDGREVGRVTAGAWSPTLECGIGYARFKRHGGWLGKSLQLQTREGECVDCEIVALPFYDADKRIPRGEA